MSTVSLIISARIDKIKHKEKKRREEIEIWYVLKRGLLNIYTSLILTTLWGKHWLRLKATITHTMDPLMLLDI